MADLLEVQPLVYRLTYNGDVVASCPPPASPRARTRATSKGKDTRYLDIHEDDQLDEAQFAVWVKQASKLPGWGKA